MAERILGPSGSKRRSNFRFLPLALIAVVALALFLAGSALAVHDQAFQLDGNTAVDAATHIGGNTQNVDWESLFDSSGSALPLPANFQDSKFVRDFRANPGCSITLPGTYCTADSSTFATGSKDTLDITPGWQCTYSNNVNSKTDLSNVYAASYTTPVVQADGKVHQILYFGLERNDNSGDGNIAFWFLQDNVGCNATISGANIPFTGHHKDGDILVVSSFTNGGTVSNVTGYRWTIDAAHPAPGYLNPTPVANGGDCGSQTLGTGDTTCAIVNKPTITVPWLTANKNDGIGHSLRESEFYEGGLDLTNSGIAGKCFSSFLGDTRSSQSLTATIFDYAGGSFEHCGANIQIAPSAVNEVGHSHTFTVHIGTTNAGQPGNAPDGTHATVTLTATNGAVISNLNDQCAASGTGTTGGTGNCTVTFTSNSAGLVTAHAAADVTIQGTTFHVETDGQSPNSGDATKRFVDAKIALSPLTAVNEVGHAHTITATVQQDDGLPSGSPGDGATGFGPAPNGTVVTFSLLNNTAGASFVGGVNQCTTSGGTGTCTVQINSTSAGTVNIHATTTFSVGGVSLTRATGDGAHGDGADVSKRYVDAKIALSPLTAVNEVGHAHTITATVQQDDGLPSGSPGDGATGFGPAPNGTLVTFSLLNNNAGASFVGGVNTCTTSGGTGTCTVQINSTSAGTVNIHATTTFSVGGVSLTRATGDGAHGDGADVSKRYVDANISLSPASATNEVRHPHTITATVQQDDGLAAAAGGDGVTGFGPAPDGTLVTFSLLNNNAGATFVGGISTCTTSGGTCSIQINSTSAGTVNIHATTTFSVGGVSLTRATGDGLSGDGGNVSKRYVDANISLSPATAVNEVGHAHTITATVQQDDGLPAGAPGDGATGFGPAPDGTLVTFSLLNNNAGASFVGGVNTCTTSGGTCTVQINSTTPGTVDIHATTTFSVGGVSLTRATGDGLSGDGSNVSKRYVDAEISIGPPTATNTVGDPHTFLVTFLQDDGLPAGAPGGDNVTGFGPVPSPTQVIVTLAPSNGAQPSLVGTGDTCASPGTDGNGHCTVTFTSPTAGTVTGNADGFVTVGNVTLERDTFGNTNIPCGGGNATCGPAVKTFVAGSLTWTKVDNANPPRLLGGATFSLCKTQSYDFATHSLVDLQQPDCSFGPVVDNTGALGYTGKDMDPTPGQFQVLGLSLGTYVLTETAAPSGYDLDGTPRTISLTPGNTDQSFGTFVNNRPVLKITGFGYTNAPTANLDQPDGIFSGTTTFTATLHNYGTSTAHLTTGSSLVVSNNATCTPSNTDDLSGIDINAGANGPSITLTCTYDHPSPTLITATLTVNYLTNGFTYHASGSPATISFTVDPNHP